MLDYNATLEALMIEHLRVPDNFAWFGEEKIGEKWGLTGLSWCENAGYEELLAQSNYETIVSDLASRFPRQIIDAGMNHWAAGPIRQLVIQVKRADGRPTKAFEAYIEWRRALQDYPVADEADLSERELNAAYEVLEDLMRYVEFKDASDLPEHWENKLAEKVFECEITWDITEDDISKAALALGFHADAMRCTCNEQMHDGQLRIDLTVESTSCPHCHGDGFVVADDSVMN